jgi:hypothetical protein
MINNSIKKNYWNPVDNWIIEFKCVFIKKMDIDLSCLKIKYTGYGSSIKTFVSDVPCNTEQLAHLSQRNMVVMM